MNDDTPAPPDDEEDFFLVYNEASDIGVGLMAMLCLALLLALVWGAC